MSKVTEGPYAAIWREWCLNMDRKIITPLMMGENPDPDVLRSVFSRFGEWERLCDEMDTMFTDEAYYQNLYEDEKDYREYKEKAMDKIAEIVCELRTYGGYITSEEGNETDRDTWNRLIDDLDTLAEGEIPKTTKKKRKIK